MTNRALDDQPGGDRYASLIEGAETSDAILDSVDGHDDLIDAAVAFAAPFIEALPGIEKIVTATRDGRGGAVVWVARSKGPDPKAAKLP